jgi:hypothetical protein
MSRVNGLKIPGLWCARIRNYLDSGTLVFYNQLKNKNNLCSLGYLKKVKLL